MKRKLLFALLIALLALCALVSGALASGGGDGESVYRAMLIGNENYSGNSVPGASTDSNCMMSTLQAANEAGSIYQSPVPRTNVKASELKTIITDMQDWNIDADDVTMLFFAGLGSLTEDGAACLVGQDGGNVKLSDLRASLDQLAGAKIIVLDCRMLEAQAEKSHLPESQAVEKFNQAAADAFRGGTTQQNYKLLTSCTMLKSVSAGNQAMGLSAPAGLFTYYLVQGCGYDYEKRRTGDLLADANLNSAVSLTEALDYVDTQIKRLATDTNQKIISNQLVYPDDSPYPLFSKRANAEVLSLSLDQPSLSIPAGKNAKLNATIQPINARQKNVTWISSDLAIAEVDKEGVVSGVRQGEATIVAMASNGMTAQCKVLIRDVTFATSVKLAASKLTIGSGTEKVLALKIEPSNSNELVNWKSSDVSVATVNEIGVVQALRNGSAVITATTETGKEVSCVIQVVAPDSVATEVKIDADSVTLFEGAAKLLSAKVGPNKAADKSVVWSSSDEKVASVEANGFVAGVGPGEATITATASSGVAHSIKATIKGAQVVFKKNTLLLKKGKRAKLNWDIEPKGTLLDVTWASSDPSVATVSDDGAIEALENGETAITATLPSGMRAVCRVSVASVIARGVKINKSRLTMSVGQQAKLTGRVSPSNASIKDVAWKSSNEKVALIDETGTITAMGVGKTTITGRTHNGKTAKCLLQVKATKVTSIVFNTDKETMMLGTSEPLQLSAEIEPVSFAGNRALNWSSSNKKVATVDQTGLVTARGPGKCTIRAASGKIKADCAITVAVNRTLHKKPVTGNAKKLYTSLRQVSYNDKEQLVVQMYFVNKSKKAQKIPTAGTLMLTLQDGQTFELGELEPNDKKKLNPGKIEVLTFRYKLADNENLMSLDLKNAKVEIAEPNQGVTDNAEEPVSDALTITGNDL